MDAGAQTRAPHHGRLPYGQPHHNAPALQSAAACGHLITQAWRDKLPASTALRQPSSLPHDRPPPSPCCD